MKKKLLILVLAVMAAGGAFAQQAAAQQAAAQESAEQEQEPQAQKSLVKDKLAVGLGLELNHNSLEKVGFGIVLGADYELPIEFAPLAAGLTFTVNFNENGVALEPAALLRWYFLVPGHASFLEKTEGSTFRGVYKPQYGFFAQADVGVTIIVEDGESAARFLAGLRAGYRMPLPLAFLPGFYVEPYGRLGYPFIFGVGVLAGIKF